MITLVICAHNSGETLAATLDSIKHQTCKNFLVLLVDNNSTDNTAKISDAFSASLPLTYVKEPQLGIQFARSRALKEINTRYFAFVDSDDLLSPYYVQELITNISDYTLPSVRYKTFDENQRIFLQSMKRRKGVKYLFPKKGQGYSFDTFQGIYQGFLWNKLFDMTIVKKYNLDFDKDISIGEDSLFIDKYIQHVNKICLTNTIGYFYRIKQNSLTDISNLTPEHIQQFLSEQKRFIYLDKTLDHNSPAFAKWCKRKAFYLKRFSKYYRIIGESYKIPALKAEALLTINNGLKCKRKPFVIFIQLLIRRLLFNTYFK